MAGNFGLILAQDMLSFYFFFALMSFSSYVLVIHERSETVRYAGKVYLVLVVLGEVLIFSGMVGVAGLAGGYVFSAMDHAWTGHPLAPWLIGALLLGFGIKAGALPLHVWLPLAHPAAPAPASAVLSGAMIKAGLLGWLRFLPLGSVTLPGWGEVLVGAGLAASLFGILFGCFQRQPKVILAYSSISKMGLMTMAVGAYMMQPAAGAAVLTGLLLFATHHALCKGALFLSVGIRPEHAGTKARRILVWLGLLIPPLSLSGWALTGGAVAKTALKASLQTYTGFFSGAFLAVCLSAGTMGTALLMMRYLWVHLAGSKTSPTPLGRPAYFAWAFLAGAVALSPLLFLWQGHAVLVAKAWGVRAAWNSTWPILLATGMAGLALFRVRRTLPTLPAGDLLGAYTWIMYWTTTQLVRVWTESRRAIPRAFIRETGRKLETVVRALDLRRGEIFLAKPEVFGVLFLGVLVLFFLILLDGA
jgi:formate hydrogenlyase subunit 3/multisubunit Na+/H+ antiporter MnhD subunit